MPVSISVQAFSYHRGIAPMMWILLTLATVELLVVHLLLSLWNRKFGLVVSALTLASLAWFIMLLRSLRRMPVLIDGDRLRMRTGRLLSLDIDRRDISGLREHWAAVDLRRTGVLKMSLLAYPNILLDLRRPISFRHKGRVRLVSAIAHRVDDPVAFKSALALFLEG